MNIFKNNHKWLAIVYGCLLIVIGALTLTFSIIDVTVVDRVISISFAVSLFIIGVLNIATALIAHTNEFFTGSILLGSLAIAFGVVLSINNSLIGEFIVYLLGAFLLALGTVCLIKAILFIVYKERVGWIIAHFVMAAAAIALGIVVLCFRNESKMMLYAFIGAILIIAGIGEIVLFIRTRVAEKKLAQEGVPLEDNEKIDQREEAVEQPKEELEEPIEE